MKKNIFTVKKNLRQYLILIPGLIGILTSCQPQSSNQTPTNTAYESNSENLSARVIYGTDGRKDLYELPAGVFKTMTQSTVALIKKTSLTSTASTTFIKSENYGTAMQLCSTEKFREQNTAAFCSGSLVGPDLILTAGHCITNEKDCADTSFVFGFALSEPDVLPQSVSSQEVYNCQSIVSRQLESGSGTDYALIKLNRPVTQHRPLAINRLNNAIVGTPLIVVGHPSGLPLKITTGGSVRSIASSKFLVANVDTYGGNSGSAVFNQETGLIEGVLVRGDQDFVYKNGCYVSNVCQDNSCRGEDITRIAMVKDLIPELPADSTPDDTSQNQDDTTNPEPTTPVLQSVAFNSINSVLIPDNKSTGIFSVVNVNELPQERQIVLSVDISHTYISDLVVKLMTSDGQTLTIWNRSGGSADNIKKSFDLTEQLKNLNTTGQFKLFIQDLAALDKGQLNSWKIEFVVKK